MNKFLIFAFIFALTNCYLKINECNSTTNVVAGNKVYIDTTNKNYEYNFEFDWTDEDKFDDFKVPISTSVDISTANVIPLFINASTIDTSSTFIHIVNNEVIENEYKYKEAIITTNDVTDGDIASIQIYKKYPVYYPFEASISSDLISATIKSTDVKANENDVTQKYIKYFAIAYCSGDGEVTVKTFDNILVTVNNGNYFSTSKILLACLALLFL